MKKEARMQARDMFIRAGGRISNRDIAKVVKVNALTVGRWKHDEHWKSEIEPSPDGAAVEPGGIIRKKEAKDKAFNIYREANGNISNKELALQVEVSPATISKWKDHDKWIDQLAREKAFGESAAANASESDNLDLGDLVSPEQIVLINRRIDALLQREFLTPREVANLAIAKSDLMSAVETYLSILRNLGDTQPLEQSNANVFET